MNTWERWFSGFLLVVAILATLFFGGCLLTTGEWSDTSGEEIWLLRIGFAVSVVALIYLGGVIKYNSWSWRK